MAEVTGLPPHVKWLMDQIRAAGKTPVLVQTHISLVIMDGEQVYKFKKPVRFDFIDLTSLQKRLETCKDEVRLNSRLCAELYHGIVPIRRDGESFSLQGEAEIVDYAVHMKQLSNEGMLDRRIERGDVTFEMIGALAGRMARFHDEQRARAEAGDDARLNTIGGYQTFLANWRDNLREINDIDADILPPDTLKCIEDFVQSSIDRLGPLLESRERAYNIIDGHGDLRADAIWIDPADPQHICIFDCLEFNERFRISDNGLDIGFLAMDLEAKGRRDLSDLLVGLYNQGFGQGGLPPFLPLFKCYRAVVRGKVRSLLAAQEEVPAAQRDAARDEARALFQLAASYAGTPGFRGLVMVCGLTGSGKSVLAGSLGARAAAPVFSTDVVRKQLSGVRPFDRLGQESYSPEITRRVYSMVLSLADEALRLGMPAIVDGTYSERGQRQAVYELARAHDLPVLVVECRVPDQVIEERQRRRESESWTVSDATFEIYLRQKATADPVDEAPAGQHLIVNTITPINESTSLVLSRLH